MKYLDFRNVSFSYGNNKILDNFSFYLNKGEILLIRGKSGIGKSTILRLISGLEILKSGNIFLDDVDISKELIEKRNVGYLFQEYALFPHMNVEKNISYGMKNPSKEKIKEFLNLIELNGYEKRYPSELSGGEKQRVALARSLASYPKVLLLDEPFSSLNEELKDKLRLELKNILKSIGISTIIVSHDKDDGLIADRIIEM